MARRKKRGKRGKAPAQPTQGTASGAPKAAPATQPAPQPAVQPEALASPSELLAWRKRMAALLEAVRAWSRLHYAEALDAYLQERFGNPDATEHARDVAAATDDFVCTPGSAGDGASILSVYCGQVSSGQTPSPTTSDSSAPKKDELAQVGRWDRERHRGVFILQRATRDRLSLWDPLEGAPLTLHLLDKLPQREADGLARGAIVTAAYQPWMARLVAVSAEYFTDPQAVQLFREQTVEASRPWHEAPAAAPEKTRSSLSKA